MKIFNWILKAFDFIKGYAELIKYIILGVSIITTLLTARGCIKEKENSQDKDVIIEHHVEKVKIDSAHYAAQAETWKISAKDLERKVAKYEDSTSQILNELSEAYKTIDSYDIRLKDAKNYIKVQSERIDTMFTPIVFDCENDTIEIAPIKSKFLDLEFKYLYDSLRIVHRYRNTNYVVIHLSAKPVQNPKRKRYGEPHLILPKAGWLWGWTEKITASHLDPDADIETVVELTFKK